MKDLQTAVDKIVKDGIDKADKGLICFSNLTVAVEEDSQVSCSRDVADLTLGNILSVTELYINGIVYHKTVLIVHIKSIFKNTCDRKHYNNSVTVDSGLVGLCLLLPSVLGVN